MKKIVSITLILFWLFPLKAFGLSEDTHLAINEEIATRDINGFSLDAYLSSQLGFVKGIKEELNGIDADNKNRTKQVIKWLGYGGVQEDRPGEWYHYLPLVGKPTRSVNHFHNPLKPWNESGLNDKILGVLSYKGQSQVLWAQDLNQNVGGKWSWQDARTYFYSGLTAKVKSERDNNFADTFRAIGQLMHLVHDASVPEHVRNDAHVMPAYEAEAENIRLKQSDLWRTWINKPIPFDKSILDIPTDPLAPTPISRIIDTDFYTGQNPEITTNSRIGLAEYTNANFLSRDTMFTDDLNSTHRHYAPYPKGSNTILWTDSSNNRRYLKKLNDGDYITHLAVASILYNDRLKYFPQYHNSLPVGLDDKCYDEYASLLIPRAVGYSAGLLNYFFRGDINLKYESGTNPGYVITNNSDEDMSGTFQVFYDKKDDNRTELWSGTLSINAHGKSGRVDFQEPDPQYAKEPGRYILVFRGTLGNEKDAVAGRVAGRLLEITPPTQYVYSIIDGSIVPQQFTKMKAKIRNATGEEIKSGTLQAVAKYIKRTDYEPDLSADPPTSETREPVFSYSVSEPIPILSLSETEPAEFTFNFINSPIPAGITDIYLQVIFKGTIGDETDTASATGTKDLAEPTHHVFWNLSDMFSLNGQLYTAEEIKNNTVLASQVDFDHDGIFNEVDIQEPYIDPVDTDLRIAYFGVNPPEGPVTNAATVDKLPAGRHVRLVLLLDRLENNYLRLTWSDDIYPESHYDFVFSGAINQDVPQEVNGQEEIVFKYTSPTTFRSWLDSDGITSIPIRQHFSQGVLNCLPYSGPHGCSFPDEGAIPVNPEPVPVNILFP